MEIRKKIKRIEQALAEKPIYHDALKLYREFLTAREKFEKTLDLAPIEIDDKFLQVKMKEGFPMLDRNRIDIDTYKLTEYILILLAIAKKRNQQGADKIESAIKEEKLSIKTICRSFLREDNNIDFKNLDPELFSFVMRQALLPFFEIYAIQLNSYFKEDQWTWGYCPICGGSAKIGGLRGEEGKRFLLCSFCNYEWPYPRLCCPFCNNEDQEKLAYFSVEEEEGFRVDLCNECKRYIKTMDSRKFDRDIVLEIDDITTLHLDILARQEGYKDSGFAEE